MSENRLQYPGEALRSWLRGLKGTSVSEEGTRLLVELANTLFFASMAKEEGAAIRARIVYHEHGLQGLRQVRENVFVAGGRGDRQAWEILPFTPKPGITDFSVEALVKLAPAAHLSRSVVVIGPHERRLRILGLARRVAYTDFKAEGEEGVIMLDAPQAGHLTLSVRGEEVFRYEYGTVVPSERRVPLHDLLFSEESAVRLALMQMCTSLVETLPKLRFLLRGGSGWYVSDVIQTLVKRMRALRHGGLIAFLPKALDVPSIRAKGKYSLPAEEGFLLRDRLNAFVSARTVHINQNFRRAFESSPVTEEQRFEAAVVDHDDKASKDDLDALVESVGQLTAVDNALVLGPNLEVLCAGYQISIPRKGPPRVYEARTIQGSPGPVYPIGQHGSRHRAAAVFAHQYPGGVVFVASQDGPVRCLHRPANKKKVLLWNLLLAED